MLRPVHDPYVKKPFPSMVGNRPIHLHVAGGENSANLVSAKDPLSKNDNFLPESYLFVCFKHSHC